MIRLRYVSNARMPTEKAHGIQIVSMARALAEAGAQVELVVPRRRNAITDDLFSYYGVPPTFTVRTLPAIDLGIGGLFGMLTFTLLQWSFARSALRDAKHDPVDVYYVRDELVFRVLALAGLPCIYEVHTIPRRFGIYRGAFLRAQKIVTISQGLLDELVRLGVPKEKILVAPDGVRIADFATLPDREESRTSFGILPHECMVLYTGQLYPWKGVDTLIEALAGAPKEMKGIIVGGGAGRLEELKEKARSLSARIDFTEQVPHASIRTYLSAADIVVIPNSGKERISREFTSPLKLFEALASGKAIVASDLPSLREILSEQTALLVPPDDPKALHEALRKLAGDPSLREELGKNAKRLSTEFDWTARARNILSGKTS